MAMEVPPAAPSQGPQQAAGPVEDWMKPPQGVPRERWVANMFAAHVAFLNTLVPHATPLVQAAGGEQAQAVAGNVTAVANDTGRPSNASASVGPTTAGADGGQPLGGGAAAPAADAAVADQGHGDGTGDTGGAAAGPSNGANSKPSAAAFMVRRGRGEWQDLSPELKQKRLEDAVHRCGRKGRKQEWLCGICAKTNWKSSARCRSCGSEEPLSIPLLPDNLPDPTQPDSIAWMCWQDMQTAFEEYNAGGFGCAATPGVGQGSGSNHGAQQGGGGPQGPAQWTEQRSQCPVHNATAVQYPAALAAAVDRARVARLGSLEFARWCQQHSWRSSSKSSGGRSSWRRSGSRAEPICHTKRLAASGSATYPYAKTHHGLVSPAPTARAQEGPGRSGWR